MKQVVILAGGQGTRLRERLGNLPKPLIDICGMPLLERQILLAQRYGFTRVVVLVNHLSEKIVEFCSKKENWGLDIECIDDGEPCGTAGAVLKVIDRLDSEFLVMYGDTMLEVDLDRFHHFHSQGGQKVAATLFLHPNDHPQDSDLVEIDEDGYVKEFFPYPHDNSKFYPNLVNAALYIVRRDALIPWSDNEGVLDFGKKLFPEMIRQGLYLRGYSSPEYIKDCGTPARLDKVISDYESGRIKRATLGHPQRAVFVDRDGTLNREVNHLKRPDQLELLPGTEAAIRRLNRSEYRVCIVTNQPVIARGECTSSDLRQVHNKLETLLGLQGAFLDRIYHCPHHPDKGFAGEVQALKIDCACRKPNTGMIDSAVLDLNISRAQSWMIGDTSVDILAAKRAGLRSILVETGYAGLDQKYLVTPDYILPNMKDAVDFILDTHPRMMQELTSCAKELEPGSLVLVGGQSRSGKSSFASVLRDKLIEIGKNCHVLSTDRWLLNESHRTSGVLGRHDMRSLINFANLIATKKCALSLALPAYNKMSRENYQDVEVLDVNIGDIVIIEGVAALSLTEVIQCETLIYVEIDEEERRSRMINEYKLRGLNEKSASEIYDKRLADEYPVVDGLKKYATLFYSEGRLKDSIPKVD